MTSSDTRAAGVLLIGESAQLLALRAWAVSQGYDLADGPDEETVCVVADEDALDGMCTPFQARQLAAARQRGAECLSPTAGWERLVALGGTERTEVGAGGVESLAGVLDFPGTSAAGKYAYGP